MTDFSDEFRELSSKARQYHTQAQAEAHQATEEWQARLRTLAAHIRKRFAEAAESAGPNTLRVDREQAAAHREPVDVLRWTDPPPERSLLTTIEFGQLWLGWRLDPKDKVQLTAPNVHEITEDQLDDLIRVIADQQLWEEHQVPDLTLTMLEGHPENTHQAPARPAAPFGVSRLSRP
jgi:hypothetical protein